MGRREIPYFYVWSTLNLRWNVSPRSFRLFITDTAVTMAVKSHLRSGKPVLLAIASNDSLLGSAKNIGELFNRKNYYFVPMMQDDIKLKPASLVAEFEMIPQAVEAAFKGIQLRPIIYSSERTAE